MLFPAKAAKEALPTYLPEGDLALGHTAVQTAAWLNEGGGRA